MSPQIYSFVTILSGVILFGLATNTLTKNYRSQYILWFTLFIYFVSAWLILNGLSVLNSDSYTWTNITGRLIFVSITLAAPCLYLFSRNYPINKTNTKEHILFVFLLPVFLIAPILYSDNLIIGFKDNPFTNTIFGSDFWLWILFYCSYTTLVLYQLITNYRTNESKSKGNLLLIIFTTAFASVLSVITSLLLPYIGITTESPWPIIIIALTWISLVYRLVVGKSPRQIKQNV